MTPAQLEELKKLCAEATPGPWWYYDGSIWASSDIKNEDGNFEYLVAESAGGPSRNFLTAARTAVPELLAEVERLRGLVKRVEWEGDDGLNASCPWCRAQRFEWREQNPHDADCDAFTPEGEVK